MVAAPIKIALDWTPNGNHVGMFVAKAQGLYAAAGLDVEFISPHRDAYKTTPASRVKSGEALLAITPSESVISHALRPPTHTKPAIQAVAAVLQSDDSAIVTLKSSGIDRPAKLEGKRYASYAARFEGRIVQQMIKNDGGSGDYQELALPFLGLWSTVLKNEADSTWVFMGWEGEEAKMKGVELNVFKLGDYGVAYGYPLVMVAATETLPANAATISKFLAATAQGYAFAAASPAEAGEAMAASVATEFPDLALDPELVKRSVGVVSKACCSSSCGGPTKWGVMEAGRWDAFLDWLSENKLLTTKVQSRGPASDTTTSLDGLRSGDAGDIIPRDAISSASLFTTEYLP